MQLNGEEQFTSHSRFVRTDPPGVPAHYSSNRHTRDGPNQIVISNASEDEVLQVRVFQCSRQEQRSASAESDQANG